MPAPWGCPFRPPYDRRRLAGAIEVVQHVADRPRPAVSSDASTRARDAAIERVLRLAVEDRALVAVPLAGAQVAAVGPLRSVLAIVVGLRGG